MLAGMQLLVQKALVLTAHQLQQLKSKTNETVTFKAGNNMMVSQAGKTIGYAVNPELKDMKSATFKDAAGNTTVTDGNGITITPGSANPNNPNAGPVSLTKDGLNNGNNQIKGVAPGSDDTDAVNVGQLKHLMLESAMLLVK